MKTNKLFMILIIILLNFCNTSNVLSQRTDEVAKNSNTSIYWAVLISAGEPERDLKNINDLRNILLNNGWEEENIYVFSESNATKDVILNTPQMLVNNGLKEDDLVLFYFSMHGGKTMDVEPFDEPDDIDEFIVPFKDEENNTGGNILDDELAYVFDCINSKNMVIIFETCYSGGMIDGDSDLKKTGRIIITSTDADETSYPIFLRKTWLFPFYLIKGLKGPADINRDKSISAEEAFVYAKKRTIIRSAIYGCLLYIFHRSLFIQHPQIYDAWPNEGDNSEELKLVSL